MINAQESHSFKPNRIATVDAALFTIPDATRLFAISRSQIYREIDAGRLEACKRGKRRLLRGDSLRRYAGVG